MIALYAATERQRSLISAALPDTEHRIAADDWDSLERTVGAANTVIIWLDSLRDDSIFLRISGLTFRFCTLPTVLITRKEADGVRRLIGIPLIEVVWTDEVVHALWPAVRRVRTRSVLQKVAVTLDRTDVLPAHLRHALARVCREDAPPPSLARLAGEVGCDRRTLWRQWHKSARSGSSLRLEDVLDWVLLLRALNLKSSHGGWAGVTKELHIHETTLGRLAKRLTGSRLSILEASDAVQLAEGFLHRVLEPALGPTRRDILPVIATFCYCFLRAATAA